LDDFIEIERKREKRGVRLKCKGFGFPQHGRPVRQAIKEETPHPPCLAASEGLFIIET
jgi:hypothetical protein